MCCAHNYTLPAVTENAEQSIIRDNSKKKEEKQTTNLNRAIPRPRRFSKHNSKKEYEAEPKKRKVTAFQ